jgi:hypothetical protein
MNTMRIKAEQFEVADPDATMARFESLLSKLVKIPKTPRERIQAERKRAKVGSKPKRKGLL